MKKILVIALAALMLAVMAVPAFAAESVTITGGFWSAWTPAYEIAVGETLEFDMEVKGGAAGWNTFFAVVSNQAFEGGVGVSAPHLVEGYAEHVLLRADNYGWSGYYDTYDGTETPQVDAEGNVTDDDGIATTFTSDLADANESGDYWDEFVAAYADAHVDATVERTATTMVFTYNVTGANGTTFTHTATQIFPEDLGDTYVFFGSDGSEVTVTPVEEAPETPDQGTTDAPQTGVATIALAIAAIASGAYIVSKKH